MRIEYDDDKDSINRFKHNVSLALGRHLLADDDTIVVPTFREEDQEERFKAIGLADGKLYTAVHVWRGDVVRLISVRRSNANEQRIYDRDSRRSE